MKICYVMEANSPVFPVYGADLAHLVGRTKSGIVFHRRVGYGERKRSDVFCFCKSDTGAAHGVANEHSRSTAAQASTCICECANINACVWFLFFRILQDASLHPLFFDFHSAGTSVSLFEMIQGHTVL